MDEVFDFGKAILALNEGCSIARLGWNGKNIFVCRQVPSTISGDIIPKMQSLPDSAKKLLLQNSDEPINYVNQMIIVNLNTRNIDSWVASSSDTFATDWYVVRN